MAELPPAAPAPAPPAPPAGSNPPPAAVGATIVTPPTPTAAPPPPSGPAPAQAVEEAFPELVEDLPPRHSDSLTKLVVALYQVQGEMTPAVKSSKNPFHKNTYADLASCWESCRPLLCKYELALIQFPWRRGRKSACVTTLLIHSSGEWMESDLTLTAGSDSAQAICGLITYARRYGFSATVGISSEDDDGQAATRTLPAGVTWQATPPGATPVNRPEPQPQPEPKAPQPQPTSGAAGGEQPVPITTTIGAVPVLAGVPPPPGKPPMRAPGAK